MERERQKFSAVVNHTDAGFLVVDPSLKVIWANKIFTERFPTSVHHTNLHGLGCNQLLCTEKDICETCPCAQTLCSGGVAHHEFRKEDREKCLKAGMDDYITKPVKPSILDEVLAKWGFE